MAKIINIKFEKLHGLGNDFVVTRLEPAAGKGTDFLSRLAQAMCHRHTGVGADGLAVVLPPRDPNNDARVRFFNADGGEAEMSGNGIRCVAGFLVHRRSRQRSLRIETPAGVKMLECLTKEDGRWLFRVAMGSPVLEPEKIPFRAKNASAPVIDYQLSTRLGRQRITVTSMGNPHCSLFVSSFQGLDWPALGREIETHPFFPNRTNVEFVRVISKREIEVRFWERGVGVTASSGTGSCGATVASILNRYTDRRVRVRTPGGALKIEWPEGEEVILTGPVERVASGLFDYRLE